MSHESTISEKTRMPIKSVAALIGTTILATGSFLSVKHDIASQRQMIEQRFSEITALQKHNWTRMHQIEWVQDFKNLNGETVKVPRIEFVEKTGAHK